MVFEIIGVLFIVVVIIIATTIINSNISKNESVISFRESMNLTELPVVTFYNGNRKLNFLLDTGSNVSYINKSIIDSLKYDNVEDKVDVIGVEGNKIPAESCKMTIFYNKHKFEENFNIIDLDNAFDTIKQESGVQIHGILGSLFFEKYKYVIDFSKLIAYMK